MSKEIYNEGRVVGFSAYELYVKNAIASGLDPESGDIATEREWLGSMLAMGAAMIVEVPSFNGKFIDIPFPSQTRLCAANTIIASFFDGEAVFLSDHWATKVMRYHPLVANGATTYPSGPTEATDIPHMVGQSGEYTRTYLKKFQDYLKIDKGVILQGGTWTESADYGLQEVEPHYDLTKVQVDKKAGEPSPVPVLRLFANRGGEYITHNPMILLIGFTDRNILRGTSVLSGGSADPIDNDHVNGGFLGPEIFPWCTPIVFTTPAGYEKYMHGIQTTDQTSDISSEYTIFDINTDLDEIYGDEENTIYTLYCESTPSDIAGVDMRYKYLSSPTLYTNVLNVYSQYGNYPPALYANFQEPVADGTVAVRHQYPVDVVAPGTVKIFRNNDNSTLSDYESTFVGTTALNLTNGILSMQGSEGLYALNSIVAGNAAVTVTRNATTGAWEISADMTGQINVVTDANTSSIKITPSTSGGVKTFTVSQTIQKKPQTTGIDVTSSNGVVNLENTMKLKPGVGIDIAKNGDEYTITNSRPVLSSSDYTNTPYTGYRVWYPLRAKQLLDPNNTYQPINGYYTGVVRRIDYSGYSWKDYILSGPDSNNPPTSYGDTAHREKLGMAYTVSMSNDIPISGVLQVSESVSVDAGDMTVVPSTYSSTLTYNTLDYCSYTDAKSNVRKFRCIRDDTLDQAPLLTNGNVNAGYWREVTAVVTAYDSSKTYYRGDYVIVNSGQYVCISNTPVTGAWQGSDWELDNATVLPAIKYGLCIADAISSGLGSSEIPTGSSLFYTHGRSYNEKGTDTIDGVTYKYYKWDHGIIARFGITPAMCKKMFFGDEDYAFRNVSRVLIDAPTSGTNDNIINWRAYVGTPSSSASNSDKIRLSYATGYRLICRYPFIVDNGNIKMATFDNISEINDGWLREHFGSAVAYDLTRDTQGGVISTTNDPYRNFAMVFDLVAETISDGLNNQLRDPITYDGHPTAPYLIASDNAHMSVQINLRMNKVSI